MEATQTEKHAKVEDIMKQKVLNVLTVASAVMLGLTLTLHIIGFFTYWESRWHLWLYIPALILLAATVVWKFAFRVPKGSFHKYSRLLERAVAVFLSLYLLVFWFSGEIGGIAASDGTYYRDVTMTEELSREEYIKLRKSSFRVSTEPLALVCVLPALFFVTRYRQSRAPVETVLNPWKTEVVPNKKKKRRHAR